MSSQSLSSSPRRSSPPTWTPEQERRLQFVTKQLHIANKHWSSEQEVWHQEVEELGELKRKYLRAVRKKEKGDGGGRLTRVRTLSGRVLRRGRSGRGKAHERAGFSDQQQEEDEEGDEEIEEDGEDEENDEGEDEDEEDDNGKEEAQPGESQQEDSGRNVRKRSLFKRILRPFR